MTEKITTTEIDAAPGSELEPLPDQDTSGIVSKQAAEDVFWLAENIDRLIEAQKKIFYGILKITIPGDFVTFGSGDKKTAELRGAACERIARDLGVTFANWTANYENGTDEKGDWYRYLYECDAIWRSRTIRVFGVAGSRTKFFGKEGGEIKPLHEVDRNDVQKSARREAMKEGVKVLFGLRHLDPGELEARGVKMLNVGGHTFKDKDEKAAEAESVTVKIADVAIAKQDKKWTLYHVKDSEGVVYKTFSQSIAAESKNAKTSGQPALITFAKSKYGLDILSVNGIKSSKEGSDGD